MFILLTSFLILIFNINASDAPEEHFRDLLSKDETSIAQTKFEVSNELIAAQLSKLNGDIQRITKRIARLELDVSKIQQKTGIESTEKNTKALNKLKRNVGNAMKRMGNAQASLLKASKLIGKKTNATCGEHMHWCVGTEKLYISRIIADTKESFKAHKHSPKYIQYISSDHEYVQKYWAIESATVLLFINNEQKQECEVPTSMDNAIRTAYAIKAGVTATAVWASAAATFGVAAAIGAPNIAKDVLHVTSEDQQGVGQSALTRTILYFEKVSTDTTGLVGAKYTIHNFCQWKPAVAEFLVGKETITSMQTTLKVYNTSNKFYLWWSNSNEENRFASNSDIKILQENTFYIVSEINKNQIANINMSDPNLTQQQIETIFEDKQPEYVFIFFENPKYKNEKPKKENYFLSTFCCKGESVSKNLGFGNLQWFKKKEDKSPEGILMCECNKDMIRLKFSKTEAKRLIGTFPIL